MQLSSFLIEKAHAVQVGVCPDGSASCSSGYTFGTYIKTFYEFSKSLGVSLFVLMVIYAGFIYITSQGDSAKLTAAKDRITGAILGYIILVLAAALLNYIVLKK